MLYSINKNYPEFNKKYKSEKELEELEMFSDETFKLTPKKIMQITDMYQIDS